ncbi:zinc finger protein 420-like [Euwallacea fornicatus]|uniref:zinc finger protein 420-like n=1 Tax=Euwallacea fornicatus TaxID=995702 RepID=UPI00338DC0EC
MEDQKSCPMAFFTPIVELAESPLETKDINSPKSNQTISVQPATSPKADVINTKDKKPNTKETDSSLIRNNSKRKRGRPKKIVDIDFEPKKPKRKYVKKAKDVVDLNKKPKRSRKQATPKKKPPEGDGVDVSLDVEEHEDLLISAEHLDLNKVIKCPICKDEREWNLKAVKQHYKETHPGKRLRISRFFGEMHPCDVCAKEFKSAASLKDHVETHNNYYYCEVCNHSTKKILDHIVHLRVHSVMGYFQCLMCDYNTTEINLITDHVTHHEDLLKYWCDSCKKSFNILQHFQEHDNYHTGLKPFDCEFCGKCFLYSRYLHAHKVNMHKEEISCPNTYQCVICHKIYQHRNSLKLHMNSHTGNFAICDICGKTLSSKEKLKFHLRTHTGYKPYSCQFCGKCFTKKPILVEHVRVHTGEKPYICDFCAKGFSQRSSLVIHMRGHTGEKPYVCQFCGKGFVAKAMLNIHLKSCRGLLQMAKFEFCLYLHRCVPRTSPQVYLLKSPTGIQVVFGAIPPKVINVAQQIRVIPAKIDAKRIQTIAPKGSIVPKVRPQPCPECGKFVLFLTEHMRRKHNKVPLNSMGSSLTPGNKTRKDRKPKICPDCGKAFIHLKLHIKLAHNKILSAPPEKPPRACPICDKKCKFLAKHIRVKHNAAAKQPRTTLCPTCGKLISDNTRHYHRTEFACDLCFISCKSKELLDEHKRVHEGDHYKCEHCPWIFLSLVDLAVHHYKHTKIYKCPKCPKTFKTYSALVHHVSLEENTFKFRCEVCGKGFTAKHLLVSHLERHENIKKYQCRFCDKKFSVKTYVKSHERLNHRKEVYGVDESFQCEYCSKMFNFECSLKRHLKLVHKVGGEKKVQCTVCSKEFTTRYSLTVHTRLHTGERNYNCTMCEERFHRAQCLTRHMARRHGVVKKRVEST